MSPLAGLAVLVTRPAERSAGLLEALERAGARPIPFPTIEIEPIADDSSPRAHRAYDLAIFVSPAAAEHGADRAERTGATGIAAVGGATARALAARGLEATIEPVGSCDSEGLLAHPALAGTAIAGRHVLIVRGEDGREQLGRSLVARGATVDYAEVYRRVRPAGADPALAAASDMTTVTSNEGVTNLLAMLDTPARARVLQRPLVVASRRQAEHARGLGFTGAIEVATGADDAAMVAAAERLAGTSSQGQTGPV